MGGGVGAAKLPVSLLRDTEPVAADRKPVLKLLWEFKSRFRPSVDSNGADVCVINGLLRAGKGGGQLPDWKINKRDHTHT
jgi:hypothetical protein